MTEFSSPITAEQTAFLADNKADLIKTEDGKRIWQNRVKMAGEAFRIAKSIHDSQALTTLVAKSLEDEDDDSDLTFPSWTTYRDNFILDWIANRTVVTVEEADMMFEKVAEEAMQAIESAEANDTTDTEVSMTAVASTTEPTPSVRKPRGRPAGSGKAKTAVAKKSYYKPKAKVAKPAKKAVKKVAAKKKSAGKGSASTKAQAIIEKYAARGWSRKDIIEKVQTQLDMGAAYASTLYQKYS